MSSVPCGTVWLLKIDQSDRSPDSKLRHESTFRMYPRGPLKKESINDERRLSAKRAQWLNTKDLRGSLISQQIIGGIGAPRGGKK